METSESGAVPEQETADVNAETVMNLALLDPPRFGWSAIGGIVDVLPPHDRARRSSTQEAHVKVVKSRERRRERQEQKKKKEAASSKIFAGTDQLSQQMMTMRPSQPNVPGDGKLPALSHLVRMNPESGNDGGGVQQNVQGEAAAALQPAAASGHDGNALLNVANNIGIQTAAQGISAAAVGLASLIMNSGAKAPPPVDTLQTAAAEPSVASQAFPQTAAASQVAREATAPSEPILARINESDDNAKGNETTAAATAPGDNTAAAASSDDKAKASSESDDNAKKSDRILRVKALDEDGVLDMYTYHRGREGMEPRDDETGQLLCDVEPTDTNHGWEPPNMKLSINISFPLTDSVDEVDTNDKSEADETSRRPQTRRQSLGQAPSDPGVQYNETIEWDLADPKTMTPMCFAMGISEEFGLDTDQTLALAESIQKQINYFIQNKVSYKTPLTLLDANGNERAGASAHPPNLRGPPQLYGSAIGDTKAGMPIPQKMLQTMKTVSRTPGPLSREPSSLERAAPPLDIEPEYRDEVLRRMRQVSRREVAKKWPEDVERVLETQDYSVCHCCSKRKTRVWTMPCKNPSHSLCSRHISTTLGIFIDEGDDPGDADHCPICALKCDCRKCTKRMSALCAELKSRCRIQGVSPDKCSCDDLFQSCAPRISTTSTERTGERRRGASKKSHLHQDVRVTVPKVPPSDFPREVCGGRDLDPGTNDDYRTVYSAEGSFVQKDAPPLEDVKLPAAVPPPSNGVQEDGNVDYCHTCKKHGNLLCCDFCPRAFHPDCISSEEPTDAEGDWECFVCRQEKESTDHDVVTGESSLDAVCASFVDFKHSEGIDACAHVLALIHATLLKLIDYDFGYMFRQPVDCKAVPDYKAIVKHPMDLGTIATRIVNGDYATKYRENLSWDDVIVAVLKDIELVWHNCFTFNFDGSSIHRMAEVQRRKYLKIRKRSFDFLLSMGVKQRVDEYVSQCDLDRSRMPRTQVPATPDRPTNGRHKITVGMRGNVKKTNKIIVVLDPDTGRVVKMYSTFKAAALAALFLLGLGHPYEFPTLTEHTLRKVIPASAKDPSMLVFGYRWLYMDDLLKRKVKFGATRRGGPGDSALGLKNVPPCTVEVKIGNDCYAFLSVEEAISWPDIPGDIPITEIRDELREMPFGKWATICGLEWRKLERNEDSAPGDNGDANAIRKCLIVDVSEHPFPTNVSFVKEDLITRRALAGFESANAAHADWLETRQHSPVRPVDEPTNLDYFTTHYLDGERNIDGMIWRTARTSAPDAANAVSNSVQQNVANSSEQETAPEFRDAAGGPEACLESSHSMSAENRLPPTTGDTPAAVEALPSLLQGYTAAPNPLAKGHFSSALHKAVNSSGGLLGEKRTHENDCLEPERANKKAAVCYS